jgi:hypothetical protein
MTSLIERFTGPADVEETPVTNPPSFTPPRGIPWWAGVPGLDPAVPVGDWAVAAPFAAMACAVRVYGVTAPYRSGLFKASPASRWYGWLLDANHADDAARRMLALRLICDHAAEIDPDSILQTARDLLAAVAQPR